MIKTRSFSKTIILGCFFISIFGGCSSIRQGTWEFSSFSDGKLVKGQFEYKWDCFPVFGVVDHSSFYEYAESTMGKGVLRVFLENGSREWLTEMFLDGKRDGLSIVWRPNGKVLRILIMREGERAESYEADFSNSSAIRYYDPSNNTWASFRRYTDGTTHWIKHPEDGRVSRDVIPSFRSSFKFDGTVGVEGESRQSTNEFQQSFGTENPSDNAPD